jgi:hypothetical protein
MFQDRFYCIDGRCGPTDVQWDDLTGIFVAETLEEAREHCRSRAALREPKQVRHLPEQLTFYRTVRALGIRALRVEVPYRQGGDQVSALGFRCLC